MSNKHGLIIDGQIFLNADYIKKMCKYDNDYGSHWIEVFTSDEKKSASYITFEDKIERDEAFDRIIKEVFGDCLEFNKNKK
jgi:hypothetical protein